MNPQLPVVLVALLGALATGGQADAQTSGTPAITSANHEDGSLIVGWTLPAGSTVTSHDLRVVKNDNETDDVNRAAREDIWARGSRVYVLDRLTNFSGHGVPARAGSPDTGGWSASSTGTPVEHSDRRTAAAVSEEGDGFVDIVGNPHEEDIRYIVDRGLTVGCDLEGPRYCPGDPVTRAQMAAFLVRALGLDTSLSYRGVYPDVPEGNWYTAFVETLGAYGLTDTQVSDSYRPTDLMLRSEMAVFLRKAFRLPLGTEKPSPWFEDVPEDAAYAEGVESILEAGITRGCGVDPLRYCPDDTVKRDTMASFLARALRASDQLRVLAYAPGRESLQTFSIGEDAWNVWVCDDAPVREDLVVYLNREVEPYYRWLSGGKYQIRFQYGTDPPPDVDQMLQNCRNEGASFPRYPEGSNIFVGYAVIYAAAVLNWTETGPEDQRFARGVWMAKPAMYDTVAYAHEIGHAFGWPHNHRDRSSPASEPLGTRMDIMAGGQLTGTNAHNLFQTGWIDPGKVKVHPGDTATYTLTPPHAGGDLELLMLPLGDDRLISIGARIKEGFDRNILKEGVELYEIELCGSPGCKHNYLPPGSRSNDPVVLDVGDSWTGQIPTVRQGTKETIEYEVSVQSRQNSTFTVRVKEASVSEGTSTADGFSSIGVGRTGVCGLLNSGTVHCWDWRGGGSIPTDEFTSVSVGHTACGTRVDGSVECWGSDNDGSQPPEGEFTTVDVNGYHACGHLTSGMVECWGSDHNKQPMVQAPEGMFISIRAGWSHACGIRPDMSLECWGHNFAGEASPPAGTFASVSAGGFFSCGIRPDKSLVCWGSNNNRKASPATGEFSYVGTGWEHACGLRTNGTVACWGNNAYGESTPPHGIFTAVSVGDARTCGLRLNGNVDCWGRER